MLKTLVLGLLSQAREHNTTANQRRISPNNLHFTLRSPKQTRLLQYVAHQVNYAEHTTQYLHELMAVATLFWLTNYFLILFR